MKKGLAENTDNIILRRLFRRDEDLIVRIRDDCRPFNVTEYYELVKDDPDKGKEISLPIIMKMAKDVRYTTAFGANNLIVRI